MTCSGQRQKQSPAAHAVTVWMCSLTARSTHRHLGKCTMMQTLLNCTFLTKAFTSQEQAGILLTNTDNSSQGYSGYSTGDGNNTQMFLLSCAEADKYLGVTYDNSSNNVSDGTAAGGGCVPPASFRRMPRT